MKELIPDLCERLHVLHLRHQIVFGELTPANPPYIPMAETLARGLADEDENAVRIARTLVDMTEMELPDFWGTPLGRLMFAAGCWTTGTVPQLVASKLLGCSRQWIHSMVKKERVGSVPSKTSEAPALLTVELRGLVKEKLDKSVN